jgi:hypothetical protein
MTARTTECPDIQRHLLPVSTPAAILRCIGRVDFDKLASSFFRFGAQLGKECRPRGICNAFRQTMVMDHAIDAEVFYTDDPKAINNLTAVLVCEVLPSPSGTFMHTSYSPPVLTSLRRAFGKFAMLALDFCQGLFFPAKEPGIGNLFTCREGGKGVG